jgi:hypothetical protein
MRAHLQAIKRTVFRMQNLQNSRFVVDGFDFNLFLRNCGAATALACKLNSIIANDAHRVFYLLIIRQCLSPVIKS